MITSVIFDIAQVIVDWDPSRFSKRIPAEDVRALLESDAFADINHRTDAGMTIEDAIAEFDTDHPALAPIYRAYIEFFDDSVVGAVPGTSEIVEELLARGVPTFGLSNWADENFHVAERNAPILARLDDLIVSARVGLAKPDPTIFSYACERFQVLPAETVMIDDTVRNLEAAATVGLATLHFTGADRLRADLASLGVL